MLSTFWIFSIIFLNFAICEEKFGKLSDYQGDTREQNPRECVERVLKEEKSLDEANESIKTCIITMSQVNSKITPNIQSKLIENLQNYYKLIKISRPDCNSQLKKHFPADKCVKSSTNFKAGDYFCNEIWGKDGCVIDKLEKYCGFDYSQDVYNIFAFLNGKEMECIETFYPSDDS